MFEDMETEVKCSVTIDLFEDVNLGKGYFNSVNTCERPGMQSMLNEC